MKRLLSILLMAMLIVTVIPMSQISFGNGTADAATTASYQYLTFMEDNYIGYVTDVDGHNYRLKTGSTAEYLQFQPKYGAKWVSIASEKYNTGANFDFRIITNGKKVYFAKTFWDEGCTRIYTVNTDGTNLKLFKKVSGLCEIYNIYGGELYVLRSVVVDGTDEYVSSICSINLSTKTLKKRASNVNSMFYSSGHGRYINGMKHYADAGNAIVCFDCKTNTIVKTIKSVAASPEGRKGKIYFLKQTHITDDVVDGVENAKYQLRRVNSDGTTNVLLATPAFVGSVYGVWVDYPFVSFYGTAFHTEDELAEMGEDADTYVYYQYNASTKKLKKVSSEKFYSDLYAVG